MLFHNYKLILAHFGSFWLIILHLLLQIGSNWLNIWGFVSSSMHISHLSQGDFSVNYAHFTRKSPWDKCEMCILEDTKPQILSQFELSHAYLFLQIGSFWLIILHLLLQIGSFWLNIWGFVSSSMHISHLSQGDFSVNYAHFTLKSPWDKCEMCILEDTKPQILSQFELILAHYPSSFAIDWLILASICLILAHYPSSFATDWLILAQYLGLRIFKYAHFTLIPR